MKPTVFLSHTSKDSGFLTPLKELLEKKLGGSVSLFLSSDGRSIPFGRNWAATVEQALQDSTLMFTFLSPQSLGSSWLYFEAGFAYARGAHVVPVAMQGTDLARTPAPISLLQGFNLRDHHGLNNLLSIINQRFELTFELSFSPEDFTRIFGSDSGISFLAVDAIVEKVEMWVKSDTDNGALIAKLIADFGLGDTCETPGFQEQKFFIAPGIQVTQNKIENEKGYRCKFELAPELIEKTFPLIERFASDGATTDRSGIEFTLHRQFKLLSPRHALLARLFGSPISQRKDGSLAFEGTSFILKQNPIRTSDGSPVWKTALIFNWDRSTTAIPYRKVITELFQREVIFSTEEPN